eukprot:CAMPEP_0175073152 /NCGR_PEP_ID=MMETSP0052_2-20121109/20371_1 /TAXON_ID=51329 ORGANISM="Polytomella parva, Strain SAG 63-3" /NCGR_SAMPLE_ID=MMETSP0052_2 /ASSEMBLY_ACC=CAM_ASM_000194 /LENGTH=320 /DNA_ID=CAMNT_0016340865 /DNA_START=46 /DNA_END=1008 /DNA_ORIENTATION=-
MTDLTVLRTAKQAFEEGLIEKNDYDSIKNAFLRAQQIKAGLDAGFISQGLYAQARDSFLHALDFSIVGTNSQLNTPARPSLISAEATQPSFHAIRTHSAIAPLQTDHKPSSMSSSSTPSPISTSPAFTPTYAAATPVTHAPVNVPAIVAISSSTSAAASSAIAFKSSSNGRLATSKKSMSGISISEDCVTVFNQIKTRSVYKWVIFCINAEGNEVIVEKVSPPNSNFETFRSGFPTDHCRYAVFDYRYQNADTQQSINKLVFVTWSPETSTIKMKMMYASTKDFFKGLLEGVNSELQATSLEELSEEEMRNRVHSALTRK